MADDKMWDEWIQMLMDMIRSGKDPDDTVKRVGVLAVWAKLSVKLNDLMPGSKVDGVTVVKVILKEDTRRPKNAMLIVTGTRGKEKVVTFHSGIGSSELWHQFWLRARAGTLVWKIDTPPGETSSEAASEGLPSMPWE